MRSKKSKKSRTANAAEKAFMGFCKEQACIACDKGFATEVHHCEGATYKRKVDFVTVHIGHWFVIPLCKGCHDFYHSNKLQFIDSFGIQENLWLRVYDIYMDTGAEAAPMDVIQGIIKPDSSTLNDEEKENE